MLLGARADLNKVDDGHHTALDEACKHGHDRIIKLLAARGAKLGFSGVKVRAPTFRDARYGDANTTLARHDHGLCSSASSSAMR